MESTRAKLRLIWPLTFAVYVALYYGWAWKIPVETALANAFRVSYVLVFSGILGALQIALGKRRWIEALGTVEGVLIIGNIGELSLKAWYAAWLTIILISGGTMYYWLFDPRPVVGSMPVLVAGIVPGVLAIFGAGDELSTAGVALLYVQAGYGILALAAVCVGVRKHAQRGDFDDLEHLPIGRG